MWTTGPPGRRAGVKLEKITCRPRTCRPARTGTPEICGLEIRTSHGLRIPRARCARGTRLVPDAESLPILRARHDVTRCPGLQLTGRRDAVSPFYRSRPLALTPGCRRRGARLDDDAQRRHVGRRYVGVVINRPNRNGPCLLLPARGRHAVHAGDRLGPGAGLPRPHPEGPEVAGSIAWPRR